LIAIVILFLGLLSIISTTMIVTRNTGAQKDVEKARQYALEIMEECEGVLFVIDKSNPEWNENVYKAMISDVTSYDLGKGKNGTLTATSEVIGIGLKPSAINPVALPNHPPISADIRVTVTWSGWRDSLVNSNRVTVEREVSVSGWQNVGDLSL
jgi:hypothetical protein